MMTCPPLDLLVALTAATLASLCGVGIAIRAPWTDQARSAGLPVFFGLALGPFLAGTAIMLPMLLLPGSGRLIHLTVWALLLGLGAVAWFRSRGRPLLAPQTIRWTPVERALGIALGLWSAGLLFNALVFPLTQNDALEYAIVGRELFQSGDLQTYPVVDPVATVSGFYGPWTHPPLYVSMIYLANLLQGHADAPGLMRLISPWFALAGMGLVVGIGRLVSLRAGLLSGLVYLSTPLFYLGADSALIDALPVSGLALLVAALVGIAPASPRRWLWLGFTLGAAIWTHSQAVLFVPLTLVAAWFQWGWREWRAAGRETVGAACVALAMAVWPYWRNLMIFGSPVSDNSPVFAHLPLDWGGYFKFARGLDQPAALIQYGLFKGWFALEAYALTFWLAAAGCAALVFQGRLPGPKSWGKGEAFRRVEPLAALLLTCYLAGVALSILVGTDLMVKNERYFLVMLPPAALLAGIGLDRWFGSGTLGRWALGALIAGLGAQLVALELYRMKALRMNPGELGVPQESLRLRRPEYQATEFLRSQAGPEGLVLSLKPADMFYADRRMLSYLDPAMIPFYQIEDPRTARKWLRRQGVSLIHVPEYGLPPEYNSRLNRILSDPALSTLVFSSEGTQIYSLESTLAPPGHREELFPGKVGWTRSISTVLGGRKALGRITGGSEELLDPDGISDSAWLGGLFHRDYSTELRSPAFALNGETGVTLRLSGHGFIRVWVEMPERRFLLGDFVMSDGLTREWGRRWKARPGNGSARIVIEHLGQSRIVLEEAIIHTGGD